MARHMFRRLAETKTLLPLVAVTLFSGCSPSLPDLPADCPSGRCECEVNADCGIEAPLCLAGACLPSEDAAVLWDQRHRLLGKERDLHGVDLGLAIRLPNSSVNGFEPQAQDEKALDWLRLSHPAGHELMLHRAGFVLLAPADGHPRHWQPQLGGLSATNPSINTDLRALVGYDLLLGLVRTLASQGLIVTPSPTAALDQGDHYIDLAEPLHVLVSDLMASKGSAASLATPRGLPLSVSLALLRRAFPQADHKHRAHENFPLPPVGDGGEGTPLSGRVLLVETTSPATLSLRSLGQPIEPQAIGCDEFASLQVNDERPVRLQPGQPLPATTLDAGTHRIALIANPRCETLFFWLRSELHSDGAIHLINWSALQAAPIDDNARPTLFTLEAGPVGDEDEDHIPDPNDLCLGLPDTGRDGDQDGVGDACDGITGYRSSNGDLELLDNSGAVVKTLEGAGEPKFVRLLRLPTAAQFDGALSGETQAKPNPFASEGGLIAQTDDNRVVMAVVGQPDSDLIVPATLCQVESNSIGLGWRHACDEHRNDFGFMPYWLQGRRRDTATALKTNANAASFALITPENPMLWLRGRDLGPAAVIAARFPAIAPDLGAPRLAAHRDRIAEALFDTPTMPCEDVCPPVQDGNQTISRSCVNGQCRSAANAGLCVSTMPDNLQIDLLRSSLRACEIGGACDQGLCVPRRIGAQGPINPRLHAAYESAAAKRQIGTVVLSPIIGARSGIHELAMAACPAALISPNEHHALLPRDQRQLLRDIANPQMESDDLLQPAMISEDGRCEPLFSNWMPRFSPALNPQSVELVDTDGDNLNEVRVGFVMDQDANNDEPTIYRCFDFTGAHRSEGCRP